MGMKTNDINAKLVSRLASYKGMHSLIARECGIGQATISRVARGEVSPTLAIAQPIFDWLDRQEALAERIRVVVAKATPISQKPKKQHTKRRRLGDLEPTSAAHG